MQLCSRKLMVIIVALAGPYLSGWSIAGIRDKLKKDFHTKGRIGTLLKPLEQHEDITKLEAREQEKNQQWAQPCGAARR